MNAINRFVSLDTAGTTLTSMAAGLGVAYAKDLAKKDVAIISAGCGLATSLVNSVLNVESAVWRAAFAAATVFATLTLLQSYGAPLASKLGLVLDPKMMSYLTFAVAGGQMVYYAMFTSKPPLNPARFLKLDEEAVKKLHAELTAKPEKFDEYSTILQILVANKFQELDLAKVKDAPELTKEVIEKLTREDCAFLLEYKIDQGEGKPTLDWTSFVEGDEERKALINRFLELNLFTQELAKEDSLPELLKELDIPQTAENVAALSSQARAFYCELFQSDAASTYWTSLPIDVQWAFVEGKPTEALPLTLNSENISKAPEATIRWIEASLPWTSFGKPEQEALKARFAALSMEHTKPCHPVNAKEVAALTTEQVEAYHAEFKDARYPNQFSDDVCAALIGRFYNMNRDLTTLPTEVFTPGRVTALPLPQSGQEATDLPEKALPWVHKALQCSLEIWYDFSERQRGINLMERFGETQLQRPIRSVDATQFNDEAIRLHHAAFTRSGDTWHKLGRSQQDAFNLRFEAVLGEGKAIGTTRWFG